jgi:hypothetical protein
MSNADAQIKEILAKYDEDFASNTWVVPGGKARAILHKCIERIVAKAGIRFALPQIVSAAPENVVLVVTGRLGELEDWSFGEASPKNNKNAYPYAMAEKRAKDRVALKLIGLHGLLYSEEEADEFKESRPRAEPAKLPPVEAQKDAFGLPAIGDRTVANALIAALRGSKTVPDLAQWFKDNANAVDGLPEYMKDEVRGAYADHLHSLKRAA